MKIIKTVLVGLCMLITTAGFAQKKKTGITDSSVTVAIQLELEENGQKHLYNITNFYYRLDRATGDRDNESYVVAITTKDLADETLLRWSGDPTLRKNCRVIILRGQQQIREYVLKGARIASFSETGWQNEYSEENDLPNANIDLTLLMEQLTINGIEIKKGQ